MGILDSLTLEQKIKAYKKTKADVAIPGAKLVLVTEEYYEKALRLFQEAFIPDEPIGKSVQLEWTDEYEALTLSSLRQNMSLMLVDEETGEPMALRIIRIFDANQNFDLTNVRDEKFKTIFEFIISVDKCVPFSKIMGRPDAFHFLGLCVAKKYRNCSLGSKIFQAALNMIGQFEFDSVFIKGEATSNYSKRIYERFTFENVYEVKYADYLVKGQQVLCNTGEHKSVKTYLKELKMSKDG